MHRGGLISALFLMLRDGKEGGEWYLMKGCNVKMKTVIKAFFVLMCRGQDFINIDSKLTCINGHRSFAIILYLSIISIQCIIHNSNIL